MAEVIYSPRFFAAHMDASFRAASLVVPIVLEMVAPKSVVDVGCGVGTWSAAFLAHGIDNVLGIDGDYVDRSQLKIPVERFRTVDLSTVDGDTPFPTFDFAFSLEVAEHLDPKRATNFVKFLTKLAPVIMFGAAVPGQGGLHHVNERWPSYWVKRFENAGYDASDVVRPKIWGMEGVPFWYQQNTLMFTRRTAWRTSSEPIRSLVHPVLYQKHRRLWMEEEARVRSLEAELESLKAEPVDGDTAGAQESADQPLEDPNHSQELLEADVIPSDDPGIERPARGSSGAPSLVVPIIVEMVKPKSVVDVGCGAGDWLASFREAGIGDVVGIDRDHIDRSRLKIPIEQFRPLDLGKVDGDTPFPTFDLALSLEVAQQLRRSRAEDFVRFLTKLAPVIVFGAAIPGQGGHNLVNPQWPAYWVKLFEDAGYEASDVLRPKIWGMQGVPFWYQQNMLMFRRKTAGPSLTEPVHSLVHPGLYQKYRRLRMETEVRIRSLEDQLAALKGEAPVVPSGGEECAEIHVEDRSPAHELFGKQATPTSVIPFDRPGMRRATGELKV